MLLFCIIRVNLCEINVRKRKLLTAFGVNGVYAIPQAWRRADKKHIKAIEARILGADEFSLKNQI